MKKISILLCAISAAITVSAQAGAQTVVSFDSASGGPATYTESGVTFSTATSGTLQFSGGPNGTTGLLAASSSGFRPELRADFLAALTGTVSVDLGDFNADADTLFLELFDSASTSLGFTSLLIGTADSTMHTLSLAGSNISFAVFGSRAPSGGGSSVYADNFTFSTDATVAAVPEPATWAMMLMGFGAMGVSLRRRKRSSSVMQLA